MIIFDALFVFFSIYGFKIAGFLDLSIIVPFAILLFFLDKKNSIDRRFVVFFVLTCTLVMYQIIIQFINANLDMTAVGRLIRSVLNVVIIGLYFSFGITKRRIYDLTIFVIVFNALVILVSSIYTPISAFLEPLTGNDAWKVFRSSGFASGFDFAGFCNIIALVMLWVYPYEIKKFSSMFMLALILLISSFMISRVTMPLSVIFFGLFVLKSFRSGYIGFWGKLFTLSLSFLIISIVTYYLAMIIDVTYGLGIINVPEEVDVISRYASQKSGSLGWESMFFLPGESIHLLLGTGSETLDSDVGYIKDIFRFGLFGLLFGFLFHIYFLLKSYHSDKKLFLVLLICFLLMVLLSFKNNYFFARTSFPIFIIISFLSVRSENLYVK